MKTSLPEIRTDRLILRPPIENDFEEWASFSADEHVMRHLGGTQPRSVAWRTMAMHTGSWLLRGFGLFSVVERSTGKWVGRAGPMKPEGWTDIEIGYSFAHSVWGRGYATEAASAAMIWSFDTLGCKQVVHYIIPENGPSIAVAERIGSTLLGETRLPPPVAHDTTFLVYGQSRP